MSQWVKAWEYCVKNKDVPDILRRYAAKRAGPILDKKARAKSKPPIRIPKGKDPRVEKKALHADCEALCKALVFHRDCGDWRSRSGKCITCPAWTDSLQWGHFMERQKAPELRYSVQATAGQCGACNGMGKGKPWEFQAAIDKRDGDGTAKSLIDRYYKKSFTWSKGNLLKWRSILVASCEAKGLPVAAILDRRISLG